MKTRNARFGIGMLITIILVAGAVGLYLFSQHEANRALNQWREKLTLIADARSREVNNWLSGQFRELGALADNASLQIYFATLIDPAAKSGGQGDYLRNLLVLTSQRLGFEASTKTVKQQVGVNVDSKVNGGLALYRMDGAVVMTTDNMPKLDKALVQKLIDAPKAEAHFLDHVNEDGSAQLIFTVPVYEVQGARDAAAQKGLLVGVRPLSDVYAALAIPEAPEKSLEVALARADDAGVRYLSPMIDAAPLLSQREEAKDSSAAHFAVTSPELYAEKTDYRGKKVLVTSRAIPMANWTLIAKVDRSEAMAATLAARNGVIAAMAMLLFALIATVLAIWRNAAARQQAQLAQEFGDQATLLSVVTENQKEPLYIIDEAMELHFVNAQAASLMKADPQALSGKTVANTIGTAFASQIEQPAQQALQTKQTQTIELVRGVGKSLQHLCLRLIPIAHIPVRGVEEPTPGVLVVEQDTTEIVLEREARLNTLNQLVAMLVSLVDKRDPNAAEHSARVATLARAAAEGMGLSAEEIETTETAARLMNLGKVDVPVELLTRDGKLNEAERDAIRSSLSASADLLKGVAFRGPVADTLRQAQEHVDGTGLMKLKGESILISARIITAANALVGMVSPRAYRSAMKADEALKILQSEAEKRYDRRVVSALTHYVDNQGGREMLERKAAKKVA